jgi:purine-cytosine permease-like protein
MSKSWSRARRVVDALFAGLTWVAAAGSILWFYDWINRWYVVVGAVLALVVAITAVENLTRQRRAAASEPGFSGLLPAPREPGVDPEAWLTAEQRIA